MSSLLEISRIKDMKPSNPFLQCELAEGHDPNETALETPLFDSTHTHYEMGARLISVPADRAFARHTHPNAYHFIYVIEGTGVIEYDGKKYILQPNECCLILKGIEHSLGAGSNGLLAMVVNTPTYANGDPAHIHYSEEETLTSIEVD